MADVGTQTTVTFGTSSFSAQITAVNGQAFERAVLDASHMGLAANAYRLKVPGDLIDAGGFTASILFDPNSQPPINAAPETITVTFPIPAGGSSGATLAGTGFVSSWTWTAPLDELMSAEMTIVWSGATGPAWTDSA